MYCKNCGQKIKPCVRFCNVCGDKILLGKFKRFKCNLLNFIKHRKIIIVLLLLFLILVIIFLFSGDVDDSSTPDVDNNIASSVVNIFCPSTVEGEETSGGSGTILTESGIILTNSHIIPQDKDSLHVDEVGCMVVLPDPDTGQAKDYYLANPIVYPGLSDDYDLAYVSIYAAYFDEEEQEYWGEYPRKFPTFDDTTRCNNENIRLGEPVRIYGYPAISGGYSLTITDGLVSSFPGDGLIVTSAKISHGNSGGLAVDKNGCMIGVPSLVNSDEMESLGIIYSMDIVNKFSDEVSKLLDQD